MIKSPKFDDAVAALGDDRPGGLGSIVDDLPIGVYVDDQSLGCTYANAEVLRMFGVSWPDFAGFGWARHVLPEDAERLQSAISDFALSQGEIDVTYRVQNRGPDERWVNAKVRAMVDSDGHHRGSIGVLRDVSTERRFHEHAGKVQKLEAVGLLAARIAHDFNNLLTAIMGAGALLEDEDRPAQRQQHLDMLNLACDQARQLTAQLLTLARRPLPQDNGVIFDKALADMSRLLDGTVGEGVTLNLTLGAPECRVALGTSQVGQVVINLATNARDAMQGRGELHLSTAQDGNELVLGVRDTGCGMDAATRDRVFEPFFTTKGPGRGSGLGLSSLHDIVALAGGSVSLDSQPGLGSTFTVRLPLIGEDVYLQPPEPAQPASSVDLTGAAVLLVEDNEAVRQSLAYGLALADFDVQVAATAQDALARLEEIGHIDVLVTDVMLPDGMGTDLARQVRQARKDLPVVFMSGYTGEAAEELAEPAPHTRFLAKPFRAEALIRAIRDTAN